MPAYIDRIASVQKAGTKAWRFALSGTAPFDIYMEGKLFIGDLDESEIVINGDSAYEPPVIEVLDSTDSNEPEQVTYPPYLVLQWRGNSAASYYQVDRYVGSAWTRQGTVKEDGSGYYRFDTDVLADETEHTFRVVPVDSDGNTGHSFSVTSLIVKNPDPPSIDITYNGVSGNAEVRARA
uniref:Uncharacterized protein n=1 Tax=viral metagenome TaxID=1070528 RepID=A0A6M3IYE6_9ZZZZ